jgi:hypothetical protein
MTTRLFALIDEGQLVTVEDCITTPSGVYATGVTVAETGQPLYPVHKSRIQAMWIADDDDECTCTPTSDVCPVCRRAAKITPIQF